MSSNSPDTLSEVHLPMVNLITSTSQTPIDNPCYYLLLILLKACFNSFLIFIFRIRTVADQVMPPVLLAQLQFNRKPFWENKCGPEVIGVVVQAICWPQVWAHEWRLPLCVSLPLVLLWRQRQLACVVMVCRSLALRPASQDSRQHTNTDKNVHILWEESIISTAHFTFIGEA